MTEQAEERAVPDGTGAMWLIGVDTGGTFTDAVVVTGDGQVAIGKSLSTHDDLTRGVVDSIAAAAATLGLAVDDVLSRADLISHGTTVGLNALLTRTGAPVGLLATAGFEGVLTMAKGNKVHGLDDEDRSRPTRWVKPPLLVPRSSTRGIRERVDASGAVVEALDEDHARQAIRDLLAQDVEAFAVSLLWSVVNPVHELRLHELIQEERPGIHVTLSSELAPRIGEYERTMTAALNASIAPVVGRHLQRLEAGLQAHGYDGPLFVMQTGGGVQRAAEVAKRAVHTLASGPVGGLGAAQAVGRRMGHTHIVSTDVGGTSFDVGLIVDDQIQYVARPMFGRYALAMPVVDIVSIGTGGGSVAWIDEALGALRVGPTSAGADPGPACYGRGGRLPTVTDAAAVLGYVDRLGGQLQLDTGAARVAVQERIADPLGMTPEEAAEGILRIATSQMADLVRRVTVQRGHDPADFVLYAYGGAAPQYAGRYAIELGVREIVIPNLASVFSAYGAIATDLRTAAEQEVRACDLHQSLDSLSDILATLEKRVVGELSAGGVGGGEVVVERRVGLRFRRQVHELKIRLADGELDAAAADAATATFLAEYERIVGRGTAQVEAGVEVVSLGVEGRMTLPTHDGPFTHEAGPDHVGERAAWFDGVEHRCPVFGASALVGGNAIDGPSFVELPTTTVVVYPGQTATIDPLGNLSIAATGGPRP